MYIGHAASLLLSIAAAAQPPKAAKPESMSTWVRSRVESALKVLDDDGDLDKARHELGVVFAQAAAYAPASDAAAFAEADWWLRLTDQLSQADKTVRPTLLKYLRAHEPLARELAMAVGPSDNTARAYGVLARLVEKEGKVVGEYPALVAAICVVYDRPHYAAAKPLEQKKPDPIDPVAVFEYFVGNEGRMLFGLKSLPPQLLVYMVDTTAAVPELEWSLHDHAGDRNVGKRYGDITYDTGAFKRAQPKKISTLPYSLENIRKVGGVCEEQAYYAAHVGKAIGDPATMIAGRGASDGHAWVGFLQQRGDTLTWNMDEGHYKEYKKLRGWVDDPQTGKEISDDALIFTAELASIPAARRHAAVAEADAAKLLLANRGQWPPPAPEGVSGALAPARPANVGAALELLQAAEGEAACCTEVWTSVVDIAGQMDSKQRTTWFERITNVCGRKYPTFAFAILSPIIQGIADPPEQSGAWDWAFREYRTHPDLAADARLHQGRLWESTGDPARAYEAYLDVSRNYSNDGTLVVDALEAAEAMLEKAGKGQAAIDMYADAFRRITRPSNTSPEFFASSNYYRVGERYAKALEKAHRDNDAANIRRLIERGAEKKKEGS